MYLIRDAPIKINSQFNPDEHQIEEFVIHIFLEEENGTRFQGSLVNLDFFKYKMNDLIQKHGKHSF